MRLWTVAAAEAAPLLALGLYLMLGSPDLPDQPFSGRLLQWRSVTDPSQLTAPELAAVLRSVLKTRPNDVEGRLLLARAQVAGGSLPEAIQTLKSASRIAPGDADVWAALGETQVQQAQGQETPAAVDAFRRALAIDPGAVSARYHLARARITGGDLNGGLADWRALAAALPDPGQRQALQSQIDASQTAGRLVEAPPAQETAQTQTQTQTQTQAQAQAQPQPPAAGPTGDQVQAAKQALVGASPADQRAFIQSMIQRMAAQLKADPHNLQGWVLLIRSYGVLGDSARQAEARAKARALFAGDAAAQAALDQASNKAP
jgi:cytochrome c-type biogenesis protein CcmH